MASPVAAIAALAAIHGAIGLQATGHQSQNERLEFVIAGTGQLADERAQALNELDIASLFGESVLQLLPGSRGEGRANRPEHAVVTHICDDRWVPGALALGQSLKQQNMKADRVLMVTDGVSKRYHKLLMKVFDMIYAKRPITKHPSVHREGSDCVTLQIFTWSLPYKKALYMDCDMLALQSPDKLFNEYGEMTAKMDSTEQDGWNGGMFMTEPSNSTFYKLQHGLQTFPGRDRLHHGMQQFFNAMFPPCSAKNVSWFTVGCLKQTLPEEHNKFTRQLTDQEVQALIEGKGKYASVHYSGDWLDYAKPWMKGCLKVSDSTHHDWLVRNDVIKLWMQFFREIDTPENKELLPHIECPAYWHKLAASP